MKIQQIPMPDGHGKVQLGRLAGYLPELCLFQGPWLAGGNVRRMVLGEPVDSADLDFFFSSSNDWFDACAQIEKVADAVLRTRQANTYRVPIGSGNQIVQFIRKSYYSNVVDLLASFDFRVCQFFTDGKTIIFPEGALADAKQKRLRTAYKGSIHTEGLHSRLHKYLGYGFRPDPKLIWSVLTKVRKASRHECDQMSDPRTYSSPETKPSDPTGLGPGWEVLTPKEKIIV